MPAAIVQSDNLTPTSNNPVSYTFFESFYGMPNVQAGHALVVFLGGGNGGSCTVTSITDNYDNTYEQIPGAYVSANGQWQDVWWAQNINPVTDPPTQLHITANLSKTDDSYCGIVVVECSGINGATLVAGTASSEPFPNAPVDGPSLNGGSGALYLASVCSTYASAGDADNSNHAAINSPWAFPAQSGPGTGGSGFSWSGPQGPCVVGLVSSGVQQPIFDTTQVNPPGSTSIDFMVISAVAFIGGSGGGPTPTDDVPTDPYLGCVTLTDGGADPQPGQSGVCYTGCVRIVATARAGVPNPYLGNFILVSAPPSGFPNPGAFLGEVTVVASPPNGARAIPLGQVKQVN
jgi:hypothetical protein